MLEVKDLKQVKLPTDKDLNLKKLDFQPNEAHGEWEPTKKDSEFDITVTFDLKNNSKVIDAISHVILKNNKTNKLFKKFLLTEAELKSSQDYTQFIDKIQTTFPKFIKNNLGDLNRHLFKNQFASKENLVKKVMAKLAEEKKKLTDDDVEDIVFQFVDRHEMDNENYSVKTKLDDEKHDLLRDLYLSDKVKKLYTYGTQKFGFTVMGLRFDVNAGYVEIKKITL